MMTASGRAQAIFNAIAQTNPGFAQLNAAEQKQMRDGLLAIFGAGDLAYLTSNAQINPGTLTSPAGATTTPAAIGAPSTVVTPTQITGLGTLS